MHTFIKAMMAAAPLTMGACASDDLAAFANGLQMASASLDAEMNACPPGMQRQTTYVQATPYTGYGPVQTGPIIYVGMTPYHVNSFCAYPVVYRDDHHNHGDRDQDRGRDRDGDGKGRGRD